MELRHYANVFVKWWWLIVASVAVAGFAAWLGSRATPRLYQSRTALMVGQVLQNPNPNASEFYTGQALAQSYSDLARREPVLVGTLNALGLDWDWATLQGMVTSRVVPSTQLLEIVVQDTNPERAKIVADEIAHQLILQSPAGSDLQREAERQFIMSQIDDLKNNIQKGRQEISQLDEVIAQATSARQIQEARTRQDSLRAQVSSWQTTYAQLLTNLQQGTTNFLSVVEPAKVSWTPVGSGASTNVLVAAAIGLVLAGGAALLLEYFDDTIKTSSDVRHVTELTTLGLIPGIDGRRDPEKLAALNEPRSPIAEAYRMLRTNLQFSDVDRPLRTLMVTSANPEEGKSVTAANLAIVMAQAGKRTILVDTDLRRPSQHRLFELNNRLGLTTLLLDTHMSLNDALQGAGIENLSILTSGTLPPNPADLLGSKRMGSLIENMEREADVVIFDSPPIMAVSDASVLANRVNGVLLIVDSGYTRRASARRSKEVLAGVGANILGVVLNRVSKRGITYVYYYAEDGNSRRKRVSGFTRRIFGRNKQAVQGSTTQTTITAEQQARQS